MEEQVPSKRMLLWAVGLLSALLPVLSWRTSGVVRRLNGLLHRSPMDEAGCAAYTVGRVLLFLLLVALVYRLRGPQSEEAEDFTNRRRGKRAPTFDALIGLRALAAFMVYMGHYFIMVFPCKEPQEPMHLAAYRLLQSCPFAGVWVFFTLSGFLMAKGFASGRYSLTADSVWQFYRNRALRILPLYAGVVFLAAVFITPDIFHPAHWWQLAEILSFDYKGNLPIRLNGVLWSVTTEVQFYFLVPFLFAGLQAVRRRGAALFPAMLLFFLLLGTAFRTWVAHKYNDQYWYYGYAPLVTNLDLFLTGMGLAFVSPVHRIARLFRGRLRVTLPIFAVMIYGSTAWAMAVYYAPGIFSNCLLLLEALPACVCVLAGGYILTTQALGTVALGEGPRSWVRRFITHTGALTYALYMLHTPIFGAIRGTLGPPAQALSARTMLLYFPLVLALVWLASEGAYRFVEEPFERRKHVTQTALLNAP